MGYGTFLLGKFLDALGHEPTSCQKRLLKRMSDFLSDDGGDDIFVINGYAGTGKTTALSAVIKTMYGLKHPCVLLAPTGRAAKVLSGYAGYPAYTVHKHIYRQKSVGGDGYGQFSLSPNKAKDTLFIVDEVSLIGIESMQGQSSQLFGSGNLLEDLVSFVRSGSGCKVVLSGDSAQLPPVGIDSSPALSEEYMSMFGGAGFVELSTVVRQKSSSGILYNATVVRNLIGMPGGCFSGFPEDLGLETSGFGDVERIKGGELIEKISDAYAEYGEDEVVVLCRSNKRAIRYNAGIRSAVQFKEERLVRDDRLMVVKNCYQFLDDVAGMDYIANGDIVKLLKISNYEDRYGLHFAKATFSMPDYGDTEITAEVILDTLEAESPALTYEQHNRLYQGVNEDYGHITSKKKRYDAVREDRYFNALQLKYANAITCHKSQGGQWKCVFIDNPFWQDFLTEDDLKWLYTAITRAVEKVYFVNFRDGFFK